MIGALRVAAVRGGALFALCCALSVHAQEPLPDRRGAGPPVVTGAPVIAPTAPAATGTVSAKPRTAAQESLLDILQQLEQVQAELRQLRDAVEVQGFELNQLKARNRDLTEDLDRRLRVLEQPAVAGDTPGSAVVPPPANTESKPVTPEQQKDYDAAFELMKQGNYAAAVKAFREFNVKHPHNGLADNAQYWIAEGTYVQRNYKQALDEFNKLVSAYPHSQKQPDALLKVGYSHYELGAYDKARKTLNEVVTRFPNTTVAKLAGARLDKMKKEGR
ncbi:MAG: tol-pal system protein YbgF [Gammaproteobacteria bacterium]|nr:tol-pal system protein YbgF [Gammaproteobacteria bacterium]